jgi:hypothetical protein
MPSLRRINGGFAAASTWSSLRYDAVYELNRDASAQGDETCE